MGDENAVEVPGITKRYRSCPPSSIEGSFSSFACCDRLLLAHSANIIILIFAFEYFGAADSRPSTAAAGGDCPIWPPHTHATAKYRSCDMMLSRAPHKQGNRRYQTPPRSGDAMMRWCVTVLPPIDSLWAYTSWVAYSWQECANTIPSMKVYSASQQRLQRRKGRCGATNAWLTGSTSPGQLNAVHAVCTKLWSTSPSTLVEYRGWSAPACPLAVTNDVFRL